MVRADRQRILKITMFHFHHLSILQELPRKANRVILDPAFWYESEGGETIEKFNNGLKSASGHELKDSTEFVLTNANILSELSNEYKYVFFTISDKSYVADMPVNHSDEWDKSLKIDDLITLGWTVYAFSEPAFLYGTYPVKFEGDNIICDEKYINDWGLLKSEELAKEVAATNNTNGDANDSYWRVIGICVDKNTFSRLRDAKAT